MEEKMTGRELVDMMARSLEEMIIGNSVRAVISLSDLYLPLFYFHTAVGYVEKKI